MRKIRKDFHDYIPFILIIVLISSSILFSFGSSYADNLKVVGDTEGLKIIPKDTEIFNLDNLNPGDTYESEIIVENKYIDCYLEIFLRTERASKEPSEGEADLFEQLELTVYLEDVLIYSGSMKDFATANTSLGNFEINKSKKMKVTVHLPGQETGNEFQGKEVVVNWIFLAQSDCKPIIPVDPDPDPTNPDPDPDPDPDPVIPVDPDPVIPTEPGDQDKEDTDEPEGIGGGEDPEEVKELEPTSLQVPRAKMEVDGVRLLQTGATPNMFYYLIGGLISVLGLGVYGKKKK